jgi:hypothetical protein
MDDGKRVMGEHSAGIEAHSVAVAAARKQSIFWLSRHFSAQLCTNERALVGACRVTKRQALFGRCCMYTLSSRNKMRTAACLMCAAAVGGVSLAFFSLSRKIWRHAIAVCLDFSNDNAYVAFGSDKSERSNSA